MKQLLKKIVLALAVTLSLVTPALAANTNDQLFKPCDTAKQNNGTTSPICKDRNTTDNPVIKTIKTASNIVALATGAAAVVLIIIGGFSMVTSAGSAEGVANARKRITYAVVGLVIVALAWLIIAFVTDQLLT